MAGKNVRPIRDWDAALKCCGSGFVWSTVEGQTDNDFSSDIVNRRRYQVMGIMPIAPRRSDPEFGIVKLVPVPHCPVERHVGRAGGLRLGRSPNMEEPIRVWRCIHFW